MTTRLEPREHREALAWGAAVALATSLPYLVGWLAAPEDRYFLGFVLNAMDQNTYFMWMTQAADGELLLRNLYTSIPHEGAMLSLIFLLGGGLGKALGSLDVAYQVLRVGAVLLLAWALWLFVATFAAERPQRRWIFLLALVGAGFGWVWNLQRLLAGDFGGTVTDAELLTRPFDLWVPEGYVFFSMLVMPHFTAAIALLLLTVRWAALGLAGDRMGLTGLAGLMCVGLSFVHPYDVLIALGLVFAVAGLNTLRTRHIDWRVWRHPLLLLAVSVGPIAYNWWILHDNPGMQAWLVQNKSASPSPLSYLAGYGLLLAGALGFAFTRVRDWGRDLAPWQWLVAWLLILPFALYAPIDFQRRLAIGASVPLAVATGLLVWEWVRTRPGLLRPGLRASVLLVLLGIAGLTSAFHWMNSFRKALDHEGELFADRAVTEALAWVGRQPGARDGTLLAGWEIGNSAPRFSGLATVIGSRGQTGNFDRVLAESRAFYAGALSDREMAGFLDAHRTAWVLVADGEPQRPAAGLDARLAALGWRLAYSGDDGGVRVLGR